MTEDNRRFARTRHRVSCEFEFGGHSHTGFVGDVSARGLFIQSTTQPTAGTELEIVLREAASPPVTLRGCVVRLAQPHRSAASVVAVGFGVQITWAPEQYYALLKTLGSESAPKAGRGRE